MRSEIVVRPEQTSVRLIAETEWEKKVLAAWWPTSTYDARGITVATEIMWSNQWSILEIQVSKSTTAAGTS